MFQIPRKPPDILNFAEGDGKNPDIFLTASRNDATTPNGYRKDLLFLQIGFRVSKPSKDRSAKNHWPLATSKSKFNN